MRTWIPISLILLTLTISGCTQPSQAPGFSPAVEPRHSTPPTAAHEQPPDEELKTRIDQLLQTLKSEDFREREKASYELKKLMKAFPEAIIPLRTALEEAKDPEVKQRLEVFLKPLRKWGITSALLRKFPDISEKLESKDASLRKQIATEIGNKKAEGAVHVLIKLLEDDEDTVSKAAMQGLTGIGKVAVEPLINALRSESWILRYCAARVLGMIQDQRAVEPLIEALKDEAMHVRNWSIWALGKIPDKRAVEPLIVALEDEDYLNRSSAAQTLGKIGDNKAVVGLVEVLKDEQWQVRYSAAKALGIIGDRRAVGPLSDTLRDKKGCVRSVAALALAKIGKPALKPLLEALVDKDKDIRRLATRALGETQDSAAVKPLIQRLKHEDNGWVREGITWALGQIDDDRAIDPLIESLKDNTVWVCRGAAEALKKITRQDFGEDYEKWKEWYDKNK